MTVTAARFRTADLFRKHDRQDSRTAFTIRLNNLVPGADFWLSATVMAKETVILAHKEQETIHGHQAAADRCNQLIKQYLKQ